MAGGAPLGSEALLLVDIWGETKSLELGPWIKEKREVTKGALLSAIPVQKISPRSDGGEPPHNYCMLKRHHVTLHCPEGTVHPLSNHEFQLLIGIKTFPARYKAFVNGMVAWGMKLKLEHPVYVSLTATSTWQAKIRWIGIPPGEEGIKFGLELTDTRSARPRCCTNGYFHGQQLFRCPNNGVLESLDNIAPIGTSYKTQITLPKVPRVPRNSLPWEAVAPSRNQAQSPLSPLDSAPPSSRFKIGDRVVAYKEDQQAVHGVVRWTGEVECDGAIINTLGIETDVYVLNSEFLVAFRGLSVDFRLENPRHGKLFLPDSMAVNEREHNFPINSRVQFSDPPQFGIIRWMGNLPHVDGGVAGVELEDGQNDGGDGTWQGKRYFSCKQGRGVFYPISQLKPAAATRSQRPLGKALSPEPRREPLAAAALLGNPLQVSLEEPVDQKVPPPTTYVGDERGIQGHQNSCYLDSTLFGLFALSDIFDEMFLEAPTTDVMRNTIRTTFWNGIVNPLRKNGVVRYESMMIMRDKLDELRKMEGITEKEKDPEEFLNLVFKYVIRVPGFVSIRRPYGVEQEYFVQLFVEHDPNLQVPTVEELLKRMFREQQISFTKAPSKLFVQVPRLGKRKIAPDVKLNILELTVSGNMPLCVICGERSSQRCSDCVEEFSYHADGSVYFCSTCSPLVHKLQGRKSHRVTNSADVDQRELHKLDLLSVICIETSHYVCFTRDLSSNKWIFFDSMADRLYDTYNIPKVTDCTRELNEWVYSGDRTRLMSTQPRQLPELVRRFTQDIYMCVYVQPDIAMYGDDDEKNGIDQLKPMSLPTPHESFGQKLRAVTQELSTSKAQLSTQEKELEEIKISKRSAEEELSACLQQYSAQKKILERSELSSRNSTLELSTCKQRLFSQQEALKKLERSNIETEEELSTCKQMLSSQRKDLEESETSKRAMKEELTIFKKHLSTQKKMFEDSTRTLEEELVTNEQQLLSLEKQLEESMESNQDLKVKLSSKESDLVRLTSLNVKLEEELAEKRSADNTHCGRITELTREIATLQSQLEGKTRELLAHRTEAWNIPADKILTTKQIGTGGWGEVLEGTVRVAVKRLHNAILNERNLERLQREMRLLAEVRHPNLVQFIGAVFDQSPPLIVTELLDINLRQAYEQNQLGAGDRLSIFMDIARALDYLHQRYEPIIHRDVSAPNVLLQRMPDNKWKGKVSDLGSANFLKDSQTMGEGALVYSPPEVFPRSYSLNMECPPQTVKIDVFSYGILVCEVTASRFPSQENHRDMILQVERESPEVHELIKKCTKKGPSSRPSMAEVIVDLNKMAPF